MMLNQITGWAVSKREPFYEVRLLVGPNLIARAEINEPRDDVCEKLDYVGKPGFSLALSPLTHVYDFAQPTRVLALSADGSHQAELSLLADLDNTCNHLKRLLQNDALGIVGHLDGITNGAVQGWAAIKDQKKAAKVWLQCKGQQPIQLLCDQYREKMASNDLPRHCGFRMPISDLPLSWKGQIMYCTYDQDGIYRLPQNELVYTLLDAFVEVLDEPLESEIINTKHRGTFSTINNRIYWQEAEVLDLILDEIEFKIEERRQRFASKPFLPLSMKRWVKNMLRLK